MSPCSLTHLVHWCKKHVNWLASEMGNGQWRMKWVVGRRRGLVESTIPLLLSIPNSFTERRGVPWKHEVRGKVQNYYDLFNECFWREVSPHQNGLIFQRFQRFQRGDIYTHFCREIAHFCREIRNMIFQKWGGGSKAVWNFSEVSSVLETPSVP